MGADARVAVVQLAAALSDRPEALALLRTLLLALGQPGAAAVLVPVKG